MMKTKLIGRLSALLAVAVLALTAVLPVGAETTAATTEAADPTSAVAYINADTGHSVMIRDDAQMLTKDEEKQLTDDMKPLTEYCDVVFYSNEIYPESVIDNIDAKRPELFDFPDLYGVIFDVRNGALLQKTRGEADRLITADRQSEIVESAREMISSGNYNTLKNIYSMAYDALCGETLPQDGGTAYVDGGTAYVNAETGYRIVILDDDALLSSEERKQLTEDMKPLTAFGDVAFWTTDEAASNELNQAQQKRYALFGMNSAAIFVINMNNRKLTIQSYGLINDSLTASKARSITDNVKGYATDRDYYQASKNAFEQMYAVVSGETIPEPMKYTSYAILALMAGLIAALTFIFSGHANPLLEDNRQMMKKTQTVPACTKVKTKLVHTDKNPGPISRIGAFAGEVLLSSITSGFRGGGGGSGGGGGFSGGGGGGFSGGGGSGGSASF